jgi:hypothetical protein
VNLNEPHPRAEDRGCCFGTGSKVSKPVQQPQGPLDPLDREFSYCLHSCICDYQTSYKHIICEEETPYSEQQIVRIRRCQSSPSDNPNHFPT